MRQDELSGRCISCVVATVRDRVQKLKKSSSSYFRERCTPRLLSVFSTFRLKRKALKGSIFIAKKQLQRSSGSDVVQWKVFRSFCQSKTMKKRLTRTDRVVLVKNISYAHIKGLVAGSLAS